MKKVLIIAEKYSSNLGDSLIYSVVNSIISKDYKTDSIDLSGRTNFTYNESSKYNGKLNFTRKIYKFLKHNFKKIGIYIIGNSMKKVNKQFESNFIKKVNEFQPDCILFAGGQMFMDSFFSQILFVIKYCKKRKTPVLFNACGCSNKMFFYEKKCIKKILNNDSVKYVSLRDKYDIVKKLDKRGIVFETYDTALLSSDYFKKTKAIDNKIGIGIMFSNFYEYKEQFNFWTSILNDLENRNVKYEIFCNGSIDDYNFIKDICSKNGINFSKVLKRPKTYMELIDVICRFNIILSMRLHSLIIAYSYGIPAIAISWDSKVREFYKKTNNSNLCFDLNSDTRKILSTLFNTKKASDFKLNSEVKEKIYKNIDYICEIINGI